MRALRTLSGVLVALIGVVTLGLAVVGWVAQRHAGPDGSFSAALSSVRTDGYAVTVPDVPSLLSHHMATALLGSDRVRITIDSASEPVLAWLVPDDELKQYLSGVRRTELSAVGFARGAQPVALVDFDGTAAPAPLVQQPFWVRAPSGRSLEWDRSTDERTSVLLLRADGQPGFAASVRVTVFASWLDEASWMSMFTGLAALTLAVALLFPRARSGELVVRQNEVDRFAELIARRLAADQRELTSGRRPHMASHLSPSLSPPLPPSLSPSPSASLAPPLAVPLAPPLSPHPLPQLAPHLPRHHQMLTPRRPAGVRPRDVTGELVTVAPLIEKTVESPYVHTAT